MAERTSEDVLAGVLRVRVGGVEKPIPTLSIAATRKWQSALAPIFMPRDWSPELVAQFGAQEIELLLDLVVAYDTTGALGGRDWLSEHADPAQLYAASLQMMEVAFPMGEPTGLLEGLIQLAELSSPPNGTSGHSPTGASIRVPSKRASTRAS